MVRLNTKSCRSLTQKLTADELANFSTKSSSWTIRIYITNKILTGCDI